MSSRRESKAEKAKDEELVSFLNAADKFEDIDADSEEEAGDTTDQVNTEVVLVDISQGSPSDEAGESNECGCWGLRCRCLRRLNQFELFLLLLTLFGLCGGLQSALKSASLTKLEKRFNFDSATSALVLMANDMVYLPSVLLVSYFGSLGHRPRLLAFSCFGYGLSGLLFALPHFLFGAAPQPTDGASANQQLGFVCPADSGLRNSTPAGAIPQGRDAGLESSVALGLFLISGFIEGLSVAPYFNLGVAFIDDITGDFSGVFIGLVIAAKILSPTLGYQLYGKVFVRLSDQLIPSEPRERASPTYIPAWWLGFAIVGLLSLLLGLPMLLFPSRPGFNAEKYRRRAAGEGGGLLCRVALRLGGKRSSRRRKSQLEAAAAGEAKPNSLLGFVGSLKRLLSNPVYVCLLCGNMFEFMEINCIIAYMVKYLNLHFRIGSGEAAVLAGIAGPGANVLGILISSCVAACVKWRVPQLAKFHACVNCFGVLAAATGFLFVCPRVDLVGGFPAGGHSGGSFIPDCSASGGPGAPQLSPFASGCNCSAAAFKPICIDGRNFFSPCAANCHARGGNVSCECMYNSTAGLSTGVVASFPLAQLRMRTNLLCSDECSSSVYTFVALFTVLKLVRLSARSQEAVLQLRCVRPRDKALGLGVTSFMFSLGGIWVPPFVGHLFDRACLFYDPRPSYKQTCLFFDTQRFRYSFVGFTTAALVPACAFFFLAWYFTVRHPKFADMSSSRRCTLEMQQPAALERRGGNDADNSPDRKEAQHL
ncbi:hypothetical protein BOX15_Mlig003984g1 [Macrostomum lignano]|uniref:Solute carrier organic anion transporter family member n=1 Tax=Macrostomum lignano TaxID=282301 RepID=A0A267H898_9PLAT|nr:hypothetical protein BOX15_Mlig003984g1 [Macrostomum lignano]